MAGAAPAPREPIVWQQILPVGPENGSRARAPGPAPVCPAGRGEEEDARLSTNARIKEPPSSSSVDARASALAQAIADRWNLPNANFWVWRLGAALASRVHHRLELLDESGELSHVRSRGGYFVACLRDAASTNGRRDDLPPEDHTEPSPDSRRRTPRNLVRPVYSSQGGRRVQRLACADCGGRDYYGKIRHRPGCRALASNGGDA